MRHAILKCSLTVAALTMTGCVIPWPRPGEVVAVPDIRGRVLDASTREPVVGATVSVDGRRPSQSQTAQNGEYHVSEIRKKYVLEMISPGGIEGYCPPAGHIVWGVHVEHPAYQDEIVSVLRWLDASRSSTNHDGPYVLRDVLLTPRTK